MTVTTHIQLLSDLKIECHEKMGYNHFEMVLYVLDNHESYDSTYMCAAFAHCYPCSLLSS